jgi:hypothetical protein
VSAPPRSKARTGLIYDADSDVHHHGARILRQEPNVETGGLMDTYCYVRTHANTLLASHIASQLFGRDLDASRSSISAA